MDPQGQSVPEILAAKDHRNPNSDRPQNPMWGLFWGYAMRLFYRDYKGMVLQQCIEAGGMHSQNGVLRCMVLGLGLILLRYTWDY